MVIHPRRSLPRLAAVALAASLALGAVSSAPGQATRPTSQSAAPTSATPIPQTPAPGAAATRRAVVPDSGLNAPSDMAPAGVTTRPATRAAASATPATGTAAGSAETAVAPGLPVVRLTPRDVRVAGVGRGRVDLAGTWNLKRDVPDSFDGTYASIPSWDQATAPDHFKRQGLGDMHKEFNVPVAWHRTFTVPPAWDGLRTRLRFESADGLCRVYVNGDLVGTTERVNTPSEFDVTDFLNGGENDLVVTLETTLAGYWSKRTMGGLARGVYLQAVPPVGIARLHVSSDLHGVPLGGDGPVDADALAAIRVANDSPEPVEGYQVRFSLTDGGTKAVPIKLRNESTPLPPIAAGAMLQMTLPLPVERVSTWTAEHPNLYHLTCELLDPSGEVVMTARQRFGFREIETRGGKLYLNGTPIKFRGTNYHMTYPGYGYFMRPDQVRHDLELFHHMNLNVLRSRPVPGIEYLDDCDEIGMYTTVEGMFTLMMYDKGPQKDYGADPSIEGSLREHLSAMLESTRSSPSILVYGLGNENPYYDYFREAAAAMQAERTGVPLFFGSDDRNGVDADWMDVNDDHYPREGVWTPDDLHRITGPGWDYPTDRPNMFTEWAHVAANNVKEYTYDPATDEFWGYVAALHVNWTYDHPHILGGFLFLGAPEVKIGAKFFWRGFFDEYRRPYDMAWHVKKADSPVYVEDRTLGDSLTIENRYDFTNVNELEANWKQGDTRGTARFDVPAQSTKTVALPTDPQGEPVELTFVDRRGEVVDQYRLTRPDQRPSRDLPKIDGGALKVTRADGGATVNVGEATFGFDKNGLLVRGDLRGEKVIAGRPTVEARATQFVNFRGNQKRSMLNQLTNWTADEIKVGEQSDRVVVTAKGKYEQAAGSIVTSVFADGRAEVAYDLTWTGDEPFNCFDWGYALRVAPAADTLRWTHDGLWSVYPPDHIGRNQGVAPAGGEAKYASARAAYTDGRKPWPWSQDLLDGATNDFRSTRFKLIAGGLYRPDGVGVTVAGRDADKFDAEPAPAGDAGRLRQRRRPVHEGVLPRRAARRRLLAGRARLPRGQHRAAPAEVAAVPPAADPEGREAGRVGPVRAGGRAAGGRRVGELRGADAVSDATANRPAERAGRPQRPAPLRLRGREPAARPARPRPAGAHAEPRPPRGGGRELHARPHADPALHARPREPGDGHLAEPARVVGDPQYPRLPPGRPVAAEPVRPAVGRGLPCCPRRQVPSRVDGNAARPRGGGVRAGGGVRRVAVGEGSAAATDE